MPRVKNGTIHRARRKKVLKQAKGYFGSKHRLYKIAKEQVMHSLSYAYRDRKQKKRDFRKLWITRINAACRANDISYSKFIDGLNKANVNVNRKMLSEIAISNPESFTKLVEIAKGGKVKPATKEVKAEVKTEAKKETKKVEKEATDLSKLTVAELRDMAKEKGIEGISTMKKADLIATLK